MNNMVFTIIPEFRILMRKLRNLSDYSTVNSEIFARILFSRIALKYIFVTIKFVTRAWSDFAISRRFSFREVSRK